MLLFLEQPFFPKSLGPMGTWLASMGAEPMGPGLLGPRPIGPALYGDAWALYVAMFGVCPLGGLLSLAFGITIAAAVLHAG